MTNQQLHKGLADPVLDSQAVFRCVLQAMARPGLVNPLPNNLVAAPSNLSQGIYAAALTLLDFETMLWLCSTCQPTHLDEILRFHCGCPITEDPHLARFAILSTQSDSTIVDRLPIGSPEYPDQSATVMIGVNGFSQGQPMTLTGPGIDGHTQMNIEGLPPGFIDQRDRACEKFPLGIDVILASERAIACLPRTTRIAA